MRIRSIHPLYLDSKGLVALRRETLLAKHVLEGKTKGYTMHPQLERFKKQPNPLGAINTYLMEVRHESNKRGYHFEKDKIGDNLTKDSISVTDGQLRYEYQRLLQKLYTRDPERYRIMKDQKQIVPHPLFHRIDGDTESREKQKEIL